MQVVLGEKAKETLAKMKEGGHVDVCSMEATHHGPDSTAFKGHVLQPPIRARVRLWALQSFLQVLICEPLEDIREPFHDLPHQIHHVPMENMIP